MVNEIIAVLKAGTIQNVIEFGDPELPAPPYIVVKPEKHPAGGVLYRLIVHMSPGQQEFLRVYTRGLYNTFERKYLTSTTGKVNKILVENDYTDITINNDDGTISMERLIWAPGQPYTL